MKTIKQSYIDTSVETRMQAMVREQAAKIGHAKEALILKSIEGLGHSPFINPELFERRIDHEQNEHFWFIKEGCEKRLITFTPIVTRMDGSVPTEITLNYY